MAYRLQLPVGNHIVHVVGTGFGEYVSDPIQVSGSTDTIVHHVELRPAPRPPQQIWYGCGVSDIPVESVCLDPERISASSLWVDTAGKWVVHSQSEWEHFWSVYQRSAEVTATISDPPRVNWQLNLVVVVGSGKTSGCQNSRRYVNRVLLYPDSTVVYVGPDEGAGELTCPAVIAPVDAVLIPRGYGSVRYRHVSRINSRRRMKGRR